MGAPGTNFEALRRAYDEAVVKYRRANLELLLQPIPAPADVQRLADARVVFDAATRAYFDAVDPGS